MPTNLPRVQCLLQPETFAKVETLRKHNRRSASHMCAELIEQALKMPIYKQQIEEALIQVPVQEDPRESIPQPGIRGKKIWAEAPTVDATPEERGQYMEMTKALIEEHKARGEKPAFVPLEQRLSLIRLANAGTITMEQAKAGMVQQVQEEEVDEEKDALRQQVEEQGAMLKQMQGLLQKLAGK